MIEVKLAAEACPQPGCHTMVWLEEQVLARLRATGEGFHCWRGHSMSFRVGPDPQRVEIERLRKVAADALAQRIRVEGERDELRQKLTDEQLPTEGLKLAFGKWLGVCPSCGKEQPRGSTKKAGARHWLNHVHVCPEQEEVKA